MSLDFIERYNLKTIVPAKNETKLDSVKKLTHLNMNGRYIENIGDLSVCSRLKVIYLHKNNIKKIQNLENLTNLTHLYLQWNKINKIENLGNLKNLKKLYLGNNEISRLENIENLKELEELHLERQNLSDGIIFEFDFKSLESIGKTVKILNISKLNLTSIDSLKPLKRLEILLASDNKFTSSIELGLSLQNLPFLLQTELHGCPAQKEIHYREKITAKTDRLESLDGKTISTGSRSFIKKLEQIKLERKSKTDFDESSQSSLSSKAGNYSSSDQSFNMLDNAESLSFRSWNSLNSKKPRRAGLHQKKFCKSFISSDVLLQGTIISTTTKS